MEAAQGGVTVNPGLRGRIGRVRCVCGKNASRRSAATWGGRLLIRKRLPPPSLYRDHSEWLTGVAFMLGCA